MISMKDEVEIEIGREGQMVIRLNIVRIDLEIN